MPRALLALFAASGLALLSLVSAAAALPPIALGLSAAKPDGAVLLAGARRRWGYPWPTDIAYFLSERFDRDDLLEEDGPVPGILPPGTPHPVIYYPPNFPRYSAPPVVVLAQPPLVDYSDIDYDLAPYRYYMRHQTEWGVVGYDK